MSNPIRVLYVDNDTHSLDVRAGILEDEYGFEVLTAGDVATAKDRLADESIHCILSDLRMPGPDGFDFLAFVREEHPALPFILFTTHDSQETVRKAFAAGATGFFPKSLVNVSYELLANRIRQAVNLHWMTETLVQRLGPEADGPRHGSTFSGPQKVDSVASLTDHPTRGEWTDSSATREPSEPLTAVSERTSRTAVADLVDDEPQAGVVAELVQSSPPDDDQPHVFDQNRPMNGPRGAGTSIERPNTDDSDSRSVTEAGAAMSSEGKDREPTADAQRQEGDSESPVSEKIVPDEGTTRLGVEEGSDSDLTGSSKRTSTSTSSDASGRTDEWSDTEVETGSEQSITVAALADSLHVAIEDAVRRVLDDRDAESETAADREQPTDETGTGRTTEAESSEDITSQRDRDTEPQSQTDQVADPQSQRDRDTEPHSQTDQDADPQSQRDRDADPQSQRDRDTEPQYEDATVQNRFHSREETLDWISPDELPSARSSGSRDADFEQPPDRTTEPTGSSKRDDTEQTPPDSQSRRRSRETAEQMTEPDDKHRQTADEDVITTQNEPVDESGEPPVDESGEPSVETESDSGGRVDLADDDQSLRKGRMEDSSSTMGDPAATEPDSAKHVDRTDKERAAVDDEDSVEPVNGGDGSLDDASPTSQTGDEDTASDTASNGFETLETGYPDGFDPEKGDSVLVQCGSQDQRKHDACVDLLYWQNEPNRNVLLVRYRQLSEDRLRRIVTRAEQVKIISLGYSQPIPDDLQEAVEQVSINNPNDLTRIGTVITATLDDWESSADGEISLCYDPVDGLLRYKSTEQAFRFLHILIGRIQSVGAISHFHADPLSSDPQEINTLKPLFDATVNIDSMGIHLE